MTEPLKPGEHVDLPGDMTEVFRHDGSRQNYYRVRTVDRRGRESTVTLEDEEVRQLAELAGYEVTDRA